jgi:hypothetical protein
MRVILDLDQLLQDNKITTEQANYFKQLAIKESGSTAINLLLALGAIAVALGVFALNFNYVAGFLIGVVFIIAGFYIGHFYKEQWSVLGSTLNLIGSFFLAGSLLMLSGDQLSTFLIIAILFIAIGFATPNRLLVALSPVAIAAALGASTYYGHAMYALAVTQPTHTIILFSVLAFIVFLLGQKLTQYTAYCNIFSRVCIILVNFGFWVGSLWGDTLRKVTDASVYQAPQISPMVFSVVWALALIFLGAWAAKEGRRFVFNTVAVFASIHFYTQWFEYLGMQPVSVLLAGCLMIVIALALWKYNKVILTRAS